MGTPRILYIARHGQTEFNRLGRFQGDPDLDQVGYVNRVSLWMLLRDRPIETVYTSQAQRTQRTAQLVALQHRLELQPRAALNEINVGVVSGICNAQINPEANDLLDQRCLVPARGSRPEVTLRELRKELGSARQLRLSDRFPLGENYYDLVKRVTPFVNELRGGAYDREVLVVAHGVINRVLLHAVAGWPLQSVVRLRQENDQVFRIESDSRGGVRQVELFTPGFGWRVCHAPSRPGQRELDCSPSPSPPSSQPAPTSLPAPAR